MHMESNRNLSSIVGRIRDDGPPAPESQAPQSVPADYLSPATRSGRAPGRRLLRLLVLLLLSAALLAGATFYLVRWYGWQPLAGFWPHASVSREPAEVAPGAAGTVSVADNARPSQANQAELDSLHDRLNQLGSQLDELSTTVSTVVADAEKRNAALDEAIRSMDESHRKALERIQGRLDALESRSQDMARADRSTKTSKPAAKPVPKKAPATAVTAPAAATAPVPETPDSPAGVEEWVVNVASSTVPEKIDEAEARMHSLGISVERQVIDFGGEVRYRLRVTGFPNSDDARRYATKLEQELGIKGAWPSRK
jgi:TolA-binding protein